MKKPTQQNTLLYILLLVGFFLFPKPVDAAGTNLEVSPSVMKIQAKPPADIWTPFTITNQSNQPITLTVGYKMFDSQASENGNVVFLKDNETMPSLNNKIFDKVQVVNDSNISENVITLGPKESSRLRLHILLSENEPISDYYFSLLFLNNNLNESKYTKTSQRTFSTLQTGIGINVLLAVGDKETPQSSISHFSTDLIRESGPVPFNLTISNNGTHFISSHGEILIKNMFGQTIGKVAIPSTVILAGTTRTINSNELSSNATTSIIKNNLAWPETFLLGLYTATITISMSDDGPIYSRSLHFFAFPFLNLILVIAVIIIVYLIYIRVKKRIV